MSYGSNYICICFGEIFSPYLQTFVENRNQKHISRNDPPERYIVFCFFHISINILQCTQSFQTLIEKQEISIPHTVITDLSMRQRLYPRFNLNVDQSLKE